MPSLIFPLGMDDAWLLPVLCLFAFTVTGLTLLFSTREPGQPQGMLGAYLSIPAIGLGFLLFWFILADLLRRGSLELWLDWIDVDRAKLQLGMMLDPLSVTMVGVVTFVALMVQVYSLGYMKGDPRLSWYYAAHSLFAAAMLALVLANNFLLLYAAWELVGLCSYLLIGHWWERPAAAEAAKKAFVTTRLGDVGLLIGILLLFKATGTFQMTEIFGMAAAGQIDRGLLTVCSLLIFLGAMGKSAQFPFHVWLPDAMEGPTPVSALIHAATMVAAGVYLTARIFPLFAAADPIALNIVTGIGLITAMLAASLALVTNDIKKVLAYSTVSQLGFMMLALGLGAVTAAMFHLVTHAFFKALLFLGSGSVIHGTERQDIWEMGGLRRFMPVTAGTFGVATLALAGLPPLSGFFSKDEILVAAAQAGLLYAPVALTAMLSAIYMGRLYFVVFLGQYRGGPEVGHDAPGRGHAPHESPTVMTVPLVLLAIPSVLAGFLALPAVGRALGLPGGFGEFVYHEHPEVFHLDPVVAGASVVLSLIGIGIAAGFYVYGTWSAATLSARFPGVYRVLVNKYYLDDAYQWIIDHIVLVIGDLVAFFDRAVVNDQGIVGPGRVTVWTGFWLRYHETGLVYNYGMAMVVGIVLLAGALVFLVSP